ncbi:MAG: 23S rRNA (guanosine(2251)-2'-O)-methyltransferase RlmB [Anaerolineae bacterium]|nr:23S rRNA (guanosine(2251)-2'-O)-methyltransferase RlmB [Anaerolineae bacterium]
MRETLYGRQAVRESLRAGRRSPFQLILAEGVVSNTIIDETIQLARKQRLITKTVSRREMESETGTEHHQGVGLITSDYPYASIEDMLDLARQRQEPPLLLLLDLIQDVQNLGTLIRTAEAAGVHGIIIQGRRAAEVTPAVVNTSSGAAEHLLIAKVTNLAQEIEKLKAAEVWLAGLEDVYGAKPYTEVDMTVPLGIVVGSEGSGLRRLVRDRCDWLMVLPMYGNINSLNAAVAGSITLYEVVRQRNQTKG